MGSKSSKSGKPSSQGPPPDAKPGEYPTITVDAGEVEDYEENEMIEVHVLPDFQIIVTKHKGKIHAFGATCPHFGAPLADGVVHDDMVKCPWHGACFSIKDGDIEDYPGNDCLPIYKVKTKKGKISVEVTNVGKMAIKKPFTDPRRLVQVIIIGAGPAGITAAQVLRENGFYGRVIMISKDTTMPYDRTALTKKLGADWDQIKLRGLGWYQKAKIEVMIKATVTEVDVEEKLCHIEGLKEPLKYHHLILASGLKPRLPNPDAIPGTTLEGVYTLKILQDSHRIKAASKGKRVVIVGAGFIGMELIGPLYDIAKKVTVLCRTRRPYNRVLGNYVGRTMQHVVCRRYKDILDFYCFDSVKAIRGKTNVQSVLTFKKRVIPCDVVIFAIGGIPDTDFIKPFQERFAEEDLVGRVLPKAPVNPLGMDNRGYIQVNEFMETVTENHYACGDCVSFPMGIAIAPYVSVGHWGTAQKMGRTAALSLLGEAGERDSFLHEVPFFWHSIGNGVTLRYVGHGEYYDHALIFGKLRKLEFCVLFKRAWKVVAALTCGCDPLICRIQFDLKAKVDFRVFPSYLTDVFPDPPIVAEGWTGIEFSQAKVFRDLEKNNPSNEISKLTARRKTPPTTLFRTSQSPIKKQSSKSKKSKSKGSKLKESKSKNIQGEFVKGPKKKVRGITTLKPLPKRDSSSSSSAGSPHYFHWDDLIPDNGQLMTRPEWKIADLLFTSHSDVRNRRHWTNYKTRNFDPLAVRYPCVSTSYIPSRFQYVKQLMMDKTLVKKRFATLVSKQRY